MSRATPRARGPTTDRRGRAPGRPLFGASGLLAALATIYAPLVASCGKPSEVLVGAAGKGAIAAFSPSGMSIHGAASLYQSALVRV